MVELVNVGDQSEPPPKSTNNEIEKSFQLVEDGDRMVHFSKFPDSEGPTLCSLPPDFYKFRSSESDCDYHNDNNDEVMEESSAQEPSSSYSTYQHEKQEHPGTFQTMSDPAPPGGNKGKVIRFCMYIFFSFYLLFAVLIFVTTNLSRTQEEHIISTIAELSVDEFLIRRIFVLNASFLAGVATLGLLAFYHHRYRLFVGFALSLLVTIIFTSITLTMALSTYNQLARLSVDQAYFESAFQDKLKLYNWTDLDNEASRFVNRFQNEFYCCGGINKYQDWLPLKPHNIPIGAFPVSCCRIHFDLQLNLLWCGYEHVEKVPGCKKAFEVHVDRLTRIYKTLNMLLGEALILQLLTVLVFCTLIWKFGKELNRTTR